MLPCILHYIMHCIHLSGLEKEVKRHENQLSELEEQQKQILANVRKDTNNLERQRQCVIRDLEKVKTQLGYVGTIFNVIVDNL